LNVKSYVCSTVCILRQLAGACFEVGATTPKRLKGSRLSDIARVGVIGRGLMGSGIAEVCARAGLDVIVREVDDAAAEAGRGRIVASLARAVKSGKLSGPERDALVERVTVTTDLSDLADCDLAIEAAAENPEVKAALFAELDRVVKRPDAILATNTSSIPIVQVARATTRPGQVIGLHFFNPAPVQKLVEVIPSLLTGPAGDIDTGMTLGCAHPVGPLRLCDLIGLDTLRSIAGSMYEEFKEPLYAAPPLLSRMTAAGMLGRKSGRGFYDYGER
jgi:3-hydroxybutyryl-CoA dehydrogenase